MEELILAQTGRRRVKNVDLVLRSGGGRTIHKQKRYEDKTLIKKKRNRQHGEDHYEEGTPLKRKKIAASLIMAMRMGSVRGNIAHGKI